MKTDMHFDDEFEVKLGDYLLTEFFYVQDVEGRELANYEIEQMTVPKRAGSYMRSRRLTAKPISIKAIMVYDSEEELREAYNQLNGILSANEPRLISFSDEDYSYYVVYASCDASEQIRGSQKITLNFFRGDPFKYGTKETRVFEDGHVRINNDATAETYPVVEVKPSGPITHIDVVNDSPGQETQYMRIGTPLSVDDTPQSRKTRVASLNMASLSGWMSGTTIDDGNVSGEMKTKSGYFYTDDFGTGTRWHGPPEKYALSQAVDDFYLEVDLANIASDRDQIGRIEVALLDIDNKQVGKVMMVKYEQGSPRMYCVAQAGDSLDNYKIINQHGKDDGTWTRFDGRLKLSRENNVWNAWVGWFNEDKNEYDRRAKGEFRDDGLDYSNPVTQIQVTVAQYGDKPVTDMKLYNILFDRYNSVAGPIYIADAGDVVTFDHKRSDILINGVSIRNNPYVSGNLESFGSKFFPLHTGFNELYTFPESLEAKVDYQKRYI